VATLLLKFVAPIQSWGSRSRFDIRDTEREPTKSGVLGLVAAALGRDRAEPIEDLATLRLGIRVDREGVIDYDYQTAQGAIKASGKPGYKYPKSPLYGKLELPETVVSRRYYLSDAAFLVGLEGDPQLLEQIEAALKRPKWTLFLGRKGYLPGEPIHFPEGGLRAFALEEALALEKPIVDRNHQEKPRFVIELPPDCSPTFPWLVHEIWDQPIAPFAKRRFGVRRVGEIALDWGEVPKPCT